MNLPHGNKDSAQNALFVGIGGGNDAFSAILAALSLKRIGLSWKNYAFAGVLSPFHFHTTTPTDMPGVVSIQPSSARFVYGKCGGSRIGFVDAEIARLLAETGPFKGCPLLGLLLKHGTDGLVASFRALGETYGTIVLVDVGGDCFYSGPSDTHVLSPMFDAMVVRAFIESGVSGILFETGTGSDGEIDPEPLRRVIEATGARPNPLHADDMAEWETLYTTYIAPTRKGNTVGTTIEAFKAETPFIERTYRARAHIDKLRMYAEHVQRIDTSLARNFFLVDPAKIKNPFAVECSDPLDWFMKTQVASHRTNCEANLELLSSNGMLGRILTPSPLFSEGDRSVILDYGLDRMWHGKTDFVLMYPSDWSGLDQKWKEWLETEGDELLTVRVKKRS